MKFLLLLTLLLPISVAYSDQAAPIFKEEVPLEAGSFRGKATLTLSKMKLKAGEKFTADIRFLNKSGGDKFYNPFFNALRPLPAELAIFDGKKNYIGNLLSNNGGSRIVGETNADWTYIASLAYVGKEYSLEAGNVFGTIYDPVFGKTKDSRDRLPNGKYYLQVIYNGLFISRNFSGGSKELFRSNPVEFEIVK